MEPARSLLKQLLVSKEISKCKNIDEIIIHTGQYFEENMSDIFFKEMKIRAPNYNLGIQSLPHGAMTGRQLEDIEKILLDEKPDWVQVYGDTNSTLAGSLLLQIKSYQLLMQKPDYVLTIEMPEEINRVLTDHVSELLFAPTDTTVENLLKEGFEKVKIFKVGDVMYDAALYFSEIAEKKSKIIDHLKNKTWTVYSLQCTVRKTQIILKD